MTTDTQTFDPRRLTPEEREGRRLLLDNAILHLAILAASVGTCLRLGYEHIPGKGYSIFSSFNHQGGGYKQDYLSGASLTEAICFLDTFTDQSPIVWGSTRQYGGSGFLGQPYIDSLTRLR